MTALDLTIHGHVQGVFYRNWTIATAHKLGITGWVRNEPDGTVSAHIEGDAAAVAGMVVRMHDGPPHARVERIEQREVEAEGFESFERR